MPQKPEWLSNEERWTYTFRKVHETLCVESGVSFDAETVWESLMSEDSLSRVFRKENGRTPTVDEVSTLRHKVASLLVA
jgi:hypothetical protein